MKKNRRDITQILKKDRIIAQLRRYVYLETFILIGVFLIVGYLLSPDDICFVKQNIPYLLIILSIITLFHGFESGMLAIGLIAIAMWFFYDHFPYSAFLTNLLMVMIFSEFHYFWTKQIKELKTNNDYVSIKLNELANAFYSLKISHDQLEKNYVSKPMSIRSAIEEILYIEKDVPEKEKKYFRNFLDFLEKSFNMQSGFILYQNQKNESEYLTTENTLVCYSSLSKEHELSKIFQEYLVDKAINFKQIIYISDDEGNPALRKELENSEFLAAIPIIYNNKILAMLIIEKMPFIAFNKENLISISILFEYLIISTLKEDFLHADNALSFIQDKDFRYEYIRMKLFYDKYKVDSTFMVFKLDNELQSRKILDKAKSMLRSLDMLTYCNKNNRFFIIFLFPLNDKSAAIGFLNRLFSNIKNSKDKDFEYMIFKIKQKKLLTEYMEEDSNA